MIFLTISEGLTGDTTETIFATIDERVVKAALDEIRRICGESPTDPPTLTVNAPLDLAPRNKP